MLTKTMFQTVCIIVLFSILHCNADTCSCTCCAGNLCTPTLQGTIPVPSCASSSCESLCQNAYPSQCTDGPGRAFYECRGGSLSTPVWPGVYSMANRCDTTTCCCPVGDMTLTGVGSNQMRVQCQFSGQCPAGSSSIDYVTDLPSGYSTQVVFMHNIILVSLSQDSRTIQLTNPQAPSCSEMATKNGALSTTTRSGTSSTTTINLVFLLISSGLMSFRQFMTWEHIYTLLLLF